MGNPSYRLLVGERGGALAAGVDLSLTTAYGWFYRWLNGKGGRASSEKLTRIVLEHAESRFEVDKRARAATLSPADTCTLVEAAARCGVSQVVMRDVLEQRGLLSRPKERGRLFRIPEAEIRGVEEAMRSLLDARRVAGVLGTTTKVMRELTVLAPLKPYVAGGRTTKHAHVYLAADAEGLLDRLSDGLPERLCIEDDETTLSAAAHAYAVPLAILCQEALQGRLSCYARLPTGRDLQALIVRREEILTVRRNARLEPKYNPLRGQASHVVTNSG